MDTPTTQLDALAGVSRTLLIPLFARAHATDLLPGIAFTDSVASALLADASLERRDVSRDLFPMRLCVARTLVLEAALKAQLTESTEASQQVLLLACGLDTLPQRLQTTNVQWLCGDFEAVVQTRAQLLPETPSITHVPMALPHDLDAIATKLDASARPIIVLEGVLPYLTPDDVRETFATLATICPQGAEIFTDSYHPTLLAFASLGNTFRKMEVTFQFGLPHPREYSALHPRLTYQTHWNLLSHLPWYTRKRCLLPQLSAGKDPLATICHLTLQPA